MTRPYLTAALIALALVGSLHGLRVVSQGVYVASHLPDLPCGTVCLRDVEP
jgi:hypothetical protein